MSVSVYICVYCNPVGSVRLSLFVFLLCFSWCSRSRGANWLAGCLCVSVFEAMFDCNVIVLQLVFEALHSQEPRGYVVGWIIAISLLVGILIFLLLAVLLWKMGFFRRRYREIIEAEKNRKDSDESWDWVEKNH